MKPTGQSKPPAGQKIVKKRVGLGLAARSALFFVIFWPCITFAQVQITEVMYDAPGSDSGHEWIEIANTGSTTADLHGYKLFEGGTNHGISVVAGTSTLVAGEVAIISNNTQNFLTDFPAYTGALFKSSFSLSNTGEALELRDSSLKPVADISYTSAQGAGGDGNSLHVSGGALVPGAPNPGSLAPTAAIIKAPVSTAKTAAPKKSSTAKSTATSKLPFGSGDASQGAASDAAPLAVLPQGDTLWTTLLGLAALIVIGVGGVLYVRSSKTALTPQETTPTAEEFDITTG